MAKDVIIRGVDDNVAEGLERIFTTCDVKWINVTLAGDEYNTMRLELVAMCYPQTDWGSSPTTTMPLGGGGGAAGRASISYGGAYSASSPVRQKILKVRKDKPAPPVNRFSVLDFDK